MQNQSESTLVESLREAGHKKVKLAVCDLDGVLRGKFIHIDKLPGILESGFGFCSVVFGWDSTDVCYDNCHYTGAHTGFPDAQAAIDPKTLRYVPWERGVPFFLADFDSKEGEGLDICPRTLLKKMLKKYHELDLFPKTGGEFEWFNFEESSESLDKKNFSSLKPMTPGMFGYSLLRASENSDYFYDLMDSLREFGIPLEGIHTETGPGVYEAALSATNALEACDRSVLFKASAKEIAKRHRVMASFMARWSDKLPGCSGHVHFSLEDSSGKNLFSDLSAPHKMSPLFRHFLAGLIHCLPDFLPLMAPTVNSYKRFVEGFWAPTRMTWGVDNRTCSLRVLNPSPSATRVEVRVPGSDINPYLVMSAILAAGYEGIEKKMALDSKPIQGNAYDDKEAPKLAGDLFESATQFQGSELAHRLLGENFVKHFANTRLWEWKQSQKAITDWELRRYFEII